VIGDGGDASLGEEIDGFIDFGDGGGVDDDVAAGVRAQGIDQQARLRAAVAFRSR